MSKYGSPEQYSRFLRSDWIKENITRIHHKAFLPRENTSRQRLEVSCYETQQLSNAEIEQIARINSILLNNKPPVGYCSINEDIFPFEIIDIEKNYMPDRHIDIIGWERYNEKVDKIEIASVLAELCSDNIIVFDE